MAEAPAPATGGEGSGGGETKGSSSSSGSTSSSSYSPLSSLEALLADAQGSELFEEYLDSEGLLNQLHFLWAVDGLKTIASSNESPQKLAQKIRIISKLVDRLVGLSESTKTKLIHDQQNLPPSVNVFDQAREEIESHMKINLLPNFLKSDIYLRNYIKLQTIIEEGVCGGGIGSAGSAATTGASDAVDKSEQVIEQMRNVGLSKDVPASSSTSSHNAGGSGTGIPAPLKLTSGALEATRRARLDGVAPSSSRLIIHHNPRKAPGSGSIINPYHASYASYNPVSRQDSEIQSLSSADGKIATSSTAFLRKLEARKNAGLSSSSSSKIDKDLPKDNLPKIHPTDAVLLMKKEIPRFDQDEFTRQLMKKLEVVAEERRRKELEASQAKATRKVVEEIRPHAIVTALRKIQSGSQVEAADDILDQHMSRVFSDKTPPIRSPPRHSSHPSQKIKKSNGSGRKKIDTYSVDSGIEFKTPGYEINPSKKPSSIRPKGPGTTTTQGDSGVSLDGSLFTRPPHRVTEWLTNSSSFHHGSHQQPISALASTSSGPLPKKSTTPPRYTIFIFYSDGPESKNSEPYRLSSDVTLTLGQLKQQLPRRGNYRYFFKKECSELSMVVQEEITRDDEFLPLFDVGKIVVNLQPL